MAVQQRVRVHGAKEWRDALDLMGLRVDRATRQGNQRAGHAVERSVKLTLRIYTHPAGTPTPSPPGAPPALISGDLMRSVHVSPTVRRRRGVYSTHVGPSARYSRIQELGGRTGRGRSTRLPARPYQKPATRAELVEIRRIYITGWQGAMGT